MPGKTGKKTKKTKKEKVPELTEAEIRDKLRHFRDVYSMYCRQFLAEPFYVKTIERFILSGTLLETVGST